MSTTRLLRTSLPDLALLGLAVFGWLLVAPLAWLIPDRRNLVVFIGRQEERFADNTKYLLLQAFRDPGDPLQTVVVSESKAVVCALREAGIRAERYPSMPAIWCLIRCRVAVVDSIEWYERFRRFLLVGARMVQLWHGVGYKRIELDKWRNEARDRAILSSRAVLFLRQAKRLISGRINRFALVIATSEFYAERVFRRAFWSRRVVVAGYPRDAFDWIAAHLDDRALRIGVDQPLLDQARTWVEQKRRVIAVLPTFRDNRASPMGLDTETVRRLETFCERTRSEIVFKFHPFEKGRIPEPGKHLHICASHADIYPLLPLCAALITDYSSIYMDYLHLDRPIVFLVPDLEAYRHGDRDLQFDFAEMSPGPHCNNWNEVIHELESPASEDQYVGQRSRLRKLAFDGHPQERSAATIRSLIEQLVRGERPLASNPEIPAP